MDDSEDLKKIDEIIRKHKIEAQDPDELEYAKFIDSSDSNDEEDESNEIEEDYEIPTFPKSDLTKFNSYTPSPFLSDEEKKVIESCSNPELKQLLLLNRNKNIQLMQVYKKIKDLLEECQKNIFIKEEFLNLMKNTKRVWNRIWRLGIPYFKTKDGFPCPRNDDIITKHKNGELLFYDMGPSNKWLEKDMNRLFKGVAFQYKVSKEKELAENIKELEKEIIENHDTEKEEIVQELKNELEDVRNSQMKLYPPLGCDKYLDWGRIADIFLKDRFSFQDCQIFWNTYLHPQINKGPWMPEENDRLKALAVEYNYQNWDLIAAELGNNRTGFVACVQYFSKVEPPRQGRFSESEDNNLIYLVEKYKQGNYIPWTKIAHCFQNRNRSQLFYRYTYFLKCRTGVVKGKFSEAEDVLILVLIDRFGKKFTKCAQYFPNRSVVQIKARYFSNLRGALKKGSFTFDEDEKILDHVKNNGPSKWEPLVRSLNRCGGQIRQRYKTLRTFMQTNPGMDIKKAPRRRYCSIAYDSGYQYLRVMSNSFKNCEKIPTLQEIEQLLNTRKPVIDPLTIEIPDDRRTYVNKGKLNRDKANQKLEKVESPPPPDSPEDVDNVEETFPNVTLSVDNLLMDFFTDSTRQNRISQQYVDRAVAVASSLLTNLRAELYIPNNFMEDARLDSLDQEILKVLTVDKPTNSNGDYVIERENFEPEKLIPPNLNTVLGMRSLLVKNQIYKTKQVKRVHIFESFKTECKEKQVQWCINNHLTRQPKNTQQLLVAERSLFFKRFVCLFKFPAIMTLEKPSELLETSSKAWKDEFTKSVKTYVVKKTHLCLTDAEDRDGTKFEGVFIKQPPPDEQCAEVIKPGVEASSKGPIKTNPFRSYGSKTKTIGNKSSEIQGAISVKTDGEPKLSIVEQLKRKINNTIDELSMSPPPKRYYKTTLISPPKPVTESYVSRKTNPQPVPTKTDVSWKTNPQPVPTKTDVSWKTNPQPVPTKTDVSWKTNPQPVPTKTDVSWKTNPQPVPTKTDVSRKTNPQPVPTKTDVSWKTNPQPVPTKSYMPKAKVKPKVAIATGSGKGGNQRKKPSVNVSKKSLDMITSDQDVGEVREKTSKRTNSNFNVGKGELVLERQSQLKTSSVNQDLMDLTALDAVLKKERGTDVGEDSFDF